VIEADKLAETAIKSFFFILAEIGVVEKRGFKNCRKLVIAYL